MNNYNKKKISNGIVTAVSAFLIVVLLAGVICLALQVGGVFKDDKDSPAIAASSCEHEWTEHTEYYVTDFIDMGESENHVGILDKIVEIDETLKNEYFSDPNEFSEYVGIIEILFELDGQVYKTALAFDEEGNQMKFIYNKQIYESNMLMRSNRDGSDLYFICDIPLSTKYRLKGFFTTMALNYNKYTELDGYGDPDILVQVFLERHTQTCAKCGMTK